MIDSLKFKDEEKQIFSEACEYFRDPISELWWCYYPNDNRYQQITVHWISSC